MAQLRRDYDQFSERDVTILVVGPDNKKRFAAYFGKHSLPFIGLPDPKHQVLRQYGQEIKLFKFGRMPAQVLIDRERVARFVHYGNSMEDIPTTAEMIALIDEM